MVKGTALNYPLTSLNFESRCGVPILVLRPVTIREERSVRNLNTVPDDLPAELFVFQGFKHEFPLRIY